VETQPESPSAVPPELPPVTYLPDEPPEFAPSPTTITRAETVELTVGFVALGVALVGVGLLLARAWRPLP